MASGVAARRNGYGVRSHLHSLPWMFVVIILAGCGGGGSGDSGGNSSPQTSITASFAPAVTNPPNNSISLSQKSVQGDLITLNVTVTSLATASSGAAFDVEFDPNLAKYIGFAPGTFYESSGTATYLAGLQSGTNNRLVVGVALQTGPGATGGGTLVELQFRAVGRGSGPLNYTNNNLTDPSGNLAPGLAWSGGALTGL